MKKYIKASRDREYDVAVCVKGIHGPISQKMVQHWALSTTSVENAKWFAIEILSGMTLDEIFYDTTIPKEKEEVLKQRVANKFDLDTNSPIGIDIAEKAFNYDIFREG